MMFPCLIAVTSLSVEAGSWAAAQVAVQRSADVSAIAGAINYLSTSNPQTAATFAARMAQLNGGNGTASPTWNSGTKTLTDNQITSQIVNGYKTSTDTALMVTMHQTIPAGMSRAFSSTTSYTVTATGVAELVSTTTGPSPGSPGSYQPCVVALSTSGTISGSGTTNLTMPSCTLRSNGTIRFNGGGNLSTEGMFAASTITITNGISYTPATLYPNDGTITDPYANNTALQTDLTTAAGLSGGSVSAITCPGSGSSGNNCNGVGTGNAGNSYNQLTTLPNGGSCNSTSGTVICTLYPGNYASLTITAGGPYVFNLQPGLYLFKGAVAFTQQTTVNGTGGVTIISAGGFSGAGGFTFNVTAPTTAQAASTGGVAGVAVASSASGTVSISGYDNFNISGVAYFPNATFDASGLTGNPGLGSTGGACMELIAASVTLGGYSDFSSNCSSLGATTFTSVGGTTTTAARVVH